MNFQDVADVLLDEGLLLTALELHVELSEKGKGLSSLKTFFENSSNFERFTRKLSVPPSPCPSTSSIDVGGGMMAGQRAGSQVNK